MHEVPFDVMIVLFSLLSFMGGATLMVTAYQLHDSSGKLFYLFIKLFSWACAFMAAVLLIAQRV